MRITELLPPQQQQQLPLSEALPISTYRRVRQQVARTPAGDGSGGGIEHLYDEFFGQDARGRARQRLYLPITVTASARAGSSGSDTSSSSSSSNDDDTTARVVEKLQDLGYIVQSSDYRAGLVKRITVQPDGSRKERDYRIGRVLKDFPQLLKLYMNDPARQSSRQGKQALQVVISRHPYDVAGQSTNRGWTSCMNLGTGSETDSQGRYTSDQRGNRRGIMAHYVPLDIRHGTLVAYLITADDTNIQNPLARVSIKPFRHLARDSAVALGVEDKVYGTAPPEFAQVVTNWVNSVNASRRLNGIFELDPNLYADSHDNRRVVGVLQDLDQYKKLILTGYPSILKHFEQVPPDFQLEVINQYQYTPDVIANIRNPTPQAQLAAVHNRWSSIEYIRNPHKSVQMAAVKQDPKAIKLIQNPDPEVVKYVEDSQERRLKSQQGPAASDGAWANSMLSQLNRMNNRR
jgi:hypothetical protein